MYNVQRCTKGQCTRYKGALKEMYKGTMYNVQRSVLFLLMAMSISLSAQDFSADRELFDAYQREDMSVWKTYIDKVQGEKKLSCRKPNATSSSSNRTSHISNPNCPKGTTRCTSLRSMCLNSVCMSLFIPSRRCLWQRMPPNWRPTIRWFSLTMVLASFMPQNPLAAKRML